MRAFMRAVIIAREREVARPDKDLRIDNQGMQIAKLTSEYLRIVVIVGNCTRARARTSDNQLINFRSRKLEVAWHS